MPSTEGLFLSVEVKQEADGQWQAKVSAEGIGAATGQGETAEVAHAAAVAAFEALPAEG